MEAGIERLTAMALIVTGLSHILAPRAWARFFIGMRNQGDVAGFLNGFVHMPLGLLIVAFHPVWRGPGLLVTLIGCGLALKGTLHFLWPSLSLRTLAPVSEDRAWGFQVAGAFGLALGLAVGWIALGQPRIPG
jgi:uncharacterized protein YjeT (DUF2065 family)